MHLDFFQKFKKLEKINYNPFYGFEDERKLGAFISNAVKKWKNELNT